ncbi:MAG: thermonuclease family protein [Candidatus Woesearchaeota archaeon]
MEKWFVFLLLLFLVSCAPAKQPAIVTKVIDGDTVTIQGGQNVRLLGINAPEKGERGYSEARDFLIMHLLMKEVVLERDKDNRDKYGRLLRYVWYNGLLVNKEIVRQGLAVAQIYPPNTKYASAIVAAEEEAMLQKRGLWKAESD